ncbi:transposase [Pseudomonas syringae]|uniref:transposase n=1 Tax=Pseudomonas syringae TaxID=317 RepID=UPI00200B1FAD|nr:transposase [Pseudomonas syringae]MCK9707583.1 transposase [Pseudomonas syringae pv. syringae]
MMTGSRLIAPEGFQCLAKGATYHFLRSDGGTNRVRLVEFADDDKELRSHLITLTRIEFEDALEAGLIVECGITDQHPPWLEPVERVSVSHRESLRVSVKESYDQKVNRRFAAISDLVFRLEETLASDSPDALINAHAKALRPQQNASRLRLWFYTYIVFGQNKWALMPPLHRIGCWKRDDPSHVRRLGRPSAKGKNWGYRSDKAMKEKILSGYLAFRSPYKTAATIYSEILTKVFGCVALKNKGKIEFIHPNGEPFPTLAQVRYQVEQSVSPRQRSIGVRGTHKTRAVSGSYGSFADRLLNVNQRAEFDGYYISEKLSGVSEGNAVDSFCVVRAVCALSGLVVGIGFAEGKENMEAYKMCLFSIASNKVRYCELFGVTIESDEWPSEGLARGLVFDRGPGANFDVESEITWLGTFENTPVFSGQSKASVEASHPRDKKTLDQPTYFHSKLNFVRMAQREIVRVLADNHTSDASRRLDEELILAGVKPTPLEIFNYWDSRGRNSAHGMQFDTAIRDFLTERPAVIRDDAVYFYGRKYRSPSLVATGVFDRVAKDGVISTMAFTLTMCVRHIWIEVYGELYELDFVRSQRTLECSVDISLRDLQAIDSIRREGSAALRDETPATQQHYRDRFKQLTGEDAFAGQRKNGRPAKNASARRDCEDFARFSGKAV